MLFGQYNCVELLSIYKACPNVVYVHIHVHVGKVQLSVSKKHIYS